MNTVVKHGLVLRVVLARLFNRVLHLCRACLESLARRQRSLSIVRCRVTVYLETDINKYPNEIIIPAGYMT